MQRERQAPLAELAHEPGLVLDQDDAALVDDADPVGHLLGLLDIVGGEDHGDALVAQPAHERPHVAAEIDVDAGGRLVEEQDLGLMGERLGDHHPPLHAARQLDDAGVALLPQREVAQEALDEGRVGRPAEQAPAERHGRPDGGEDVERDLLRHEADLRARGAKVSRHVVPVDEKPCPRSSTPCRR